MTAPCSTKRPLVLEQGTVSIAEVDRSLTTGPVRAFPVTLGTGGIQYV
jgi:hypothetical protein